MRGWILAGLLLSSGVAMAEGRLEVCTSEYPPFEYMNGGKVTGSDVELVRQAVGKMGMELEVFIAPWTRCEKMAEAGTVAAIMSLSYSEKRAQIVHFSKPISQIRDVFFKRKADAITWESLADVADKRIGVSGGYQYHASFEEAKKSGLLPHVEEVSSGTPEYQNLKKLAHGRIDLFVCEVNACQHILHSHPAEFGGIDFIDRSIGPVRTFHVGFSRAHPGGKRLQERFDAALP